MRTKIALLAASTLVMALTLWGAIAATTQPAVPEPPRITAAGATDHYPVVRVYGQAFPAGNERPGDAHLYAQKLGLRPGWTLGSFNALPMLADADGNLITEYGPGNPVHPDNLDWARQGNFTDPASPLAAKIAGLLCRRPTTFSLVGAGAEHRKALKPYLPLFIDFENTAAFNAKGLPDTLETHRQVTRNYLALADQLRYWTFYDTELWFYNGHPWKYWKHDDDPEYVALNKELAKRLSGFCGDFYNWDIPAETNGDLWFNMVDQSDVLIEQYYPQWRRSKVAFVLPVYCVYWPQNAIRPDTPAKDGKPLPLAVWKRQIRYLADRGWHIYVWTGNTPLPGIEHHLEYVAKFAR